MNSLELLQALYRKVGGPGTSPTTLSGLTGYQADCLDWLQESWRYIQGMEHLWWWKYTLTDKTLTIGKAEYDLSADLGMTDVRFLDMENVILWDTSVGSDDMSKLEVISRTQFDNTFRMGSQQLNRPTYICQLAQYKYGLGPSPDAAWTVRLPYFQATTDFSTDTDETNIPLEYQDIIIHRAAMYWAEREENGFRYQVEATHFKDLKDKMTNDPRMIQNGVDLPAIGHQ